MIDAALVIPVYRSRDGELHIVMILRQPGGVHGGQVAFPGGKHDPEDETMLDTAIREVREELGLLIDRAETTFFNRMHTPKGSSSFRPGNDRNRYHFTRSARIDSGGFLIGSCIRLFRGLWRASGIYEQKQGFRG